jgi:hypothetical protein
MAALSGDGSGGVASPFATWIVAVSASMAPAIKLLTHFPALLHFLACEENSHHFQHAPAGWPGVRLPKTLEAC